MGVNAENPWFEAMLRRAIRIQYQVLERRMLDIDQPALPGTPPHLLIERARRLIHRMREDPT